MEDSQIVDLYWRRDERAVLETGVKYGAFCHALAMNILANHEDAEECVNDTYQKAWNAMPPQRPERLRAWLGRVTRNIALNRWNRGHAQKRYGGAELLLSELEDCIPSPRTVEGYIDDAELSAAISDWLFSLPLEDRRLFVRRYWYGEALNTLAVERSISPKQLAQKMYRLRLRLKAALEKEEIYL